MSLNKNKSIRKGFSKRRFPVVLALSNGLFIHLVGCNASQIKNEIREIESTSYNNNNNNDTQPNQLPRLSIDHQFKNDLIKYDKPSLENCVRKIHQICTILCEEIPVFSVPNSSQNNKPKELREDIQKLQTIRLTESEQLKMHKPISDFVTDIHDILNSTEDEDVKIEFIYDIYKTLYQQIHGPDAEPNMDINLYKKELLEAIQKLEQTRWLKQLDVLVKYIKEFATRSQYVLNLKVHNSSFREQEQEYIKQFMNWLSLFHITLIRDWIPNISTETEPNTESNYPNSLQILEELPPSY